MISRRPNNLQEDQLITAYLQRWVIIISVTQDSDGEQYFIDGVSFSKLRPVHFACWGDETIIELYRKDVRWDIHTAYGDPRLAYLREKVQRAKDEYHRSLEITPLSWLQKFELVMGCIGLMVICRGLVELLLKLVR